MESAGQLNLPRSVKVNTQTDPLNKNKLVSLFNRIFILAQLVSQQPDVPMGS